MDLWRISPFHNLDGEGGLKASGRWHTKGRRIVYLSDSPACALIEYLAHFDFDLEQIPVSFPLLRIEAPKTISRLAVEENDLLAHWREDYRVTRRIGNRWLAAGKEALLVCPSALVPRTFNWALNPQHPEAAKVTIAEIIKPPLDPRLLRRSLSLPVD